MGREKAHPPGEVYYLDGLEPGEDGEVSAVTAGANPGAHILLLKRKRDRLEGRRDMLSSNDQRDPRQEATVPKDAKERQELLLKLDPEQKAEIEAMMKSAAEEATKPLLEKVSALEARNKELEAQQKEEEDEDEAMKAFVDSLPEAMRAPYLAMPEDQQAAFRAMVEAAPEGPSPVEAMAKSFESFQKKNRELEEDLTKLRDDQEQQAVVKELADLSKVVKLEDFAQDVRKLRKADPDAADRMVEKVRALAAQAEEGGLLKVIGGDGDGDGASAIVKVRQKVAKIREAQPTIKSHEAMDMVMKAEPALWDQYMNERN